ncbi:MAG TPA: endonuclease/exonuclease/phosphatase family protein [Draconibacterium sp.]|nr:endonuclease/exonuclease/phosphatase family protein [Draconibacterium sp.]
MRLIHWNCQGSFRTKNEWILSLKPDILVVSECEKSEKLGFGKFTPTPNDFYWHGEIDNKGIGIFSYSSYKFKLLDIFNPEFKFILPFNVTGNGQNFILFAIWTMDNKQLPQTSYIVQVWLAINYYKDLLNDTAILIGDFNSNQIWDSKYRFGNHTDVVNKLKEYDIFSLYHEQNRQNQGKETKPTFYMYRKIDKPYHLDYCFASRKIFEKGFEFIVGEYNDWIDKSDHTPIIINFNNKRSMIVLEAGTEGGSVQLLFENNQFSYFTNESALADFFDDPEDMVFTRMSHQFNTFDLAMKSLMNRYQIFSLYPLEVNPEFSGQIIGYYKKFISENGENTWGRQNWDEILQLD